MRSLETTVAALVGLSLVSSSAASPGDASPIFGTYSKQTTGNAEWMKQYSDDTLLVHMNIPGTHNSATWNYTQATQNALRQFTDQNGMTLPAPESVRCQEQPVIKMLNSGIRAIDLRYAFDPNKTSLVFYHTAALLSETATVGNLLEAFYQWLDDHPSETLFLSMQYEPSTSKSGSNETALQHKLYNALTSDEAKRYFVQDQELGTLGESRGKITLLRRFDLDQLPSGDTESLPGPHFSQSLWEDNGPEIALTYNTTKNLTAYIGDYYHPVTAPGSSAAENIRWKYNATTRNILKATTQHRDSLFWTWASGTNAGNNPPDWPQTLAVGNGSDSTPDGGVNHQLVPFFKGQKGKRLGIVMFDFFDQPSDLIDTFLAV